MRPFPFQSISLIVFLLAVSPAVAAPSDHDSLIAPTDDFANDLSATDLANAEPLPLPLETPQAPRESIEFEGQRGAPSVPLRDADRAAFSRRIPGDVQSVPLRYTGKLFIARGDKRVHCSGQFITPRVVLTAAHCVRDTNTGAWYDDYRFALQYQRGFAAKQYGYACVSTKQGWVKKSPSDPTPREWDYAMLLVKEPTRTGHFAWAADWRGSYQRAVKVGYPGEVHEGKIINVDQGPLFFPRDRKGIVGLRHNNPRSGPGSSGGAFVANFSTAEGSSVNRVISVTSFSYNGEPDVDYGPYFDAQFKMMLDYVSRGCRNP